MSDGGPDAPGRPGGGTSARSAVLRAEDVRVRYGGETAVAVDELEVREGELLVLLGPNGAGKSTLMRVLALLETPDEGRVAYRGREGRGAERSLRAEATAVFQRPHLWAGTVGDSLRRGLRLQGVAGAEADRRAAEAARALGLEELLERPVEELSAGQRQRTALARALAPEPRVLFLDEPTAGLDAGARDALRRDVERVARRSGRSTLLVTHDRREAFRLADRIAVLEEGRLVRVGTPDELYERPGSPYVARVSGAELALRGRVAAAGEGATPAPTDGARGRGDADAPEVVPAPDGDPGGDRLLRVEVDGIELLALGRGAPAQEVVVAYRPEDLALASAAGDGHGREAASGAGPGGPGSAAGRDSVRNAFPAVVEELRQVRGLVRVRLRGPPDVVAVVTRGSAEALGLEPGARVRVRVKAAALHAFPA